MLIGLAIICSCQKQDSTAEAQLAQRKTELDAREETLIQREKTVEEREKAVAEKEKALANTRIIQSQRQAPNAAQAEAERQKRIQQLPPEFRALIPDRSRVDAKRAEKDPTTQQPPGVQTQQGADQSQQQSEAIRQKNAIYGGLASPLPQAPDGNTTSQPASPTPQ